MYFSKRLFTLCCLFASFSSAETVDHSGWYVGGAIGSSKTQLEISNFSNSENIESHQVYGGYNFNQWFGVESNFFISGDVSDNQPGVRNAYFTGLSLTPKISIQATSHLVFFAKAGIAGLAYTEEYSRRYNEDYYYDNGYRYRKDQSWSDHVSTYSAGAEWSMTNKLKLRIIYDYLSGSIEEDDSDYYYDYADKIDVTLKNISFGAHYQF